MTEWSLTDTEAWVLIVTTLVSIPALYLLTLPLWPRPLPFAFDPDDAWNRTLATSERDRVLGAARGIATTSTAFLAALLSALLKGELVQSISPFALIGCSLGIVGTLLLAGSLSVATRWHMIAPEFEPRRGRRWWIW